MTSKTYKLEFIPAALKEWKKLGATLKEQFKKKLSERMQNPHAPKDRLSGDTNLYKINLRSAGYRVVHDVDDHTITILVLSVGKRERSEVYNKEFQRCTD